MYVVWSRKERTGKRGVSHITLKGKTFQHREQPLWRLRPTMHGMPEGLHSQEEEMRRRWQRVNSERKKARPDHEEPTSLDKYFGLFFS